MKFSSSFLCELEIKGGGIRIGMIRDPINVLGAGPAHRDLLVVYKYYLTHTPLSPSGGPRHAHRIKLKNQRRGREDDRRSSRPISGL